MQPSLTAKQCNICLNKFRARYFLNKQVALALLWIFLIWTYAGYGFMGSGSDLVYSVSSHLAYYNNTEYDFYKIFLGLPVMISGFSSTWVAGWKYRMPDIIFAGMVTSGIGTLIENVLEIVVSVTGKHNIGIKIIYYIAGILLHFGCGPVLANLFQLAMEQIPDASASQMSSLVNWTVFTAVLGSWSSTLLTQLYSCFSNYFATSFLNISYTERNDTIIISSLFSIIIALALSTFALQKHILMDNSPSSNVIKNIYKVVKYAIQHKHPQRRSAMTYWEERIPSRLALGKAKYGGPFTSEQVEDVSTFLQIGALYLAAALYLCTLYLNEYSLYYIDHQNEWNGTFSLIGSNTTCYTHRTLYHFAGYNYWWLLVSILIYELLLVPVLGYRMPSMLSRVILSTLLAMLISIIITILIIINSYSNKSYTVSWLGLQVGLSLPMGVARAIFYTAGLEFLCAQSPYAMRNFFISLGICIGWMCPNTSGLIFTLWARKCTSHVSCPVIYSTITMALHGIGLAVFWVSMRKYRKRSRGHEDEHQQKWVEEIYDKYVRNM